MYQSTGIIRLRDNLVTQLSNSIQCQRPFALLDRSLQSFVVFMSMMQVFMFRLILNFFESLVRSPRNLRGYKETFNLPVLLMKLFEYF